MLNLASFDHGLLEADNLEDSTKTTLDLVTQLAFKSEQSPE